jgi:hypothetical protein
MVGPGVRNGARDDEARPPSGGRSSGCQSWGQEFEKGREVRRGHPVSAADGPDNGGVAGGQVVSEVEGDEGERRGRGGRRGRLRALGQGSAPGVEGGFGEAVSSAEGADGEAAVLPAGEGVAPELLFAGVTGLALRHRRYLRNRVE